MRPLWQDVTLADLATLLNGLAGLTSIYFAANGDFVSAAWFILAAVILDGVDGGIARLGGGGGPLGKSIDGLCDMVSFAAAPAILLTLAGPAWMAAVAAIYFTMATLRLARFAAEDDSDKRGWFVGLSSPAAALFVAGTSWAFPDAVVALAIITLVAAAMMVTLILYPKLRGWLGFVGVALIVVAMLSHFLPIPYGPEAMLAFMLYYLLAGPTYVRNHGTA